MGKGQHLHCARSKIDRATFSISHHTPRTLQEVGDVLQLRDVVARVAAVLLHQREDVVELLDDVYYYTTIKIPSNFDRTTFHHTTPRRVKLTLQAYLG